MLGGEWLSELMRLKPNTCIQNSQGKKAVECLPVLYGSTTGKNETWIDLFNHLLAVNLRLEWIVCKALLNDGRATMIALEGIHVRLCALPDGLFDHVMRQLVAS